MGLKTARGLFNVKNVKNRNKFLMAVQIRIFIVIIVTATVINLSGLAVGSHFLTNNILMSIEDQMLVTLDLADKYVSKEIEFLKIKTSEIARNIMFLNNTGAREGVLENLLKEYPMFIGFAVFNNNSLLEFSSSVAIHPDLFKKPFMQRAFLGGQAVSNTMRTPDGHLVIYISAPIESGLVLAAVISGLHFNNLISEFTFWETGHLFIDDETGTAIANINERFVLDRVSFIDTAEAESDYHELSHMIKRGIAGERGTAHFTFNNAPHIGAVQPLSSPTENWALSIIAPLSESVLRDIPRIIFLIASITIALSICAAILGSIVLRRPYSQIDGLRKAAEAASISKSTFLANMSHEIRTPMNSIVGFSELALDDDVSPKTRDYISKIQINAEWLLQIINDILDISKIESGKMELENIPFDMHELFTSCRTLIMPKAVEKGISLYFYAEPSIGRMPVGDPTRLRQVLVNLLSNAVKFTRTGMIKLNAALKSSDETGISMHFEVKDSGIGMTSEQINKIFDPFIQAESGTTRQYGGTGLGLSITKNIVEMMGGKLFVESTLGVGSKFSFDLTFNTIEVSKNDIFTPKVILKELEKPAFEGEILLCEDNTMNQQIICEHLARVGLKTIVAENGKIGVDMVQGRIAKGEKQFDLVLMDMHMPVMDGLEASHKILALNSAIPIVAMTANIMSNDRDIYKSHGINDCVGKPFTSQELWRCLMKYFKPLVWQTEEETKSAQAETELRIKLIKTFLRDNKTKFSEIVEAIGSDDIKAAHRYAHTLKSNAGQLGKILLQQAAEDIERNLKNGENLVTQQQMSVLKTELNAALSELSAHLDKITLTSSVEVKSEHIDKDASLKILNEVKPMLEMGNPECRTFIESLKQIKGSELLIHQMEDLDFEPAMATLEELKENLEEGKTVPHDNRIPL